jgi:hypothetical protein
MLNVTKPIYRLGTCTRVLHSGGIRTRDPASAFLIGIAGRSIANLGFFVQRATRFFYNRRVLHAAWR